MSEHAESEKGVRSYQEGDYATALLEFRQLGEQGLASAQDDFGVMYAKGAGETQGYARAHMWFNIAVSSGEGLCKGGTRGCEEDER
ncbi:MAG: hypothetical protein OEY57_06660 [Nitrospirota bacterium]|nr:hypothetical protein [Nitrospirota bacterium]